jgi:NAD(P)-dependent dehydrogenase (short-subunit alcohol dehydrogenase family)
MQGLARDLGPRGITINNVQPGPVDTELNPDDGEFAEMDRKNADGDVRATLSAHRVKRGVHAHSFAVVDLEFVAVGSASLKAPRLMLQDSQFDQSMRSSLISAIDKEVMRGSSLSTIASMTSRFFR